MAIKIKMDVDQILPIEKRDKFIKEFSRLGFGFINWQKYPMKNSTTLFFEQNPSPSVEKPKALPREEKPAVHEM